VLAEEKIVRNVVVMWAGGKEATKDSWRQHASQSLIWWNSARGALRGLDACEQAIDSLFDILGVASIKVPIKAVAAGAGLVFIERSDDMYRQDGSLIAAVPVTGVVQFDGDKIVEWRDYCDDWMRAYRPDGANKALA